MIDKYYSVDYLHRLYNMYDDKCVKEYIDQRIECIYNITNNDVFLKSNYIDDEHVDLNKLNNDGLISCVILTYNEEMCIRRCLESVIDIFDEIIVMDTGSIDNTIDIIESFKNSKIKLYKETWHDDFSSIRNLAASKAKFQWIFFLDADEFIMDISYKKLHTYICGLSNFDEKDNIVLCPTIIDDGINYVHRDISRIFYNSQNCYYYGLIHEEIRTRKGTPLFFHTNINILHDGYRADILIKKDKKNRNLNLLKKMISLEPSNIRWRYFYLKEGFNNLSLKEIEEVVNTFLVKNETCDLIYENVDVNNYTFFIIELLCRKYIQNNKYLEAKKCTKIMESIIPQNSDSIYFDVLCSYLESKEKIINLLNELVYYRKSHFSTQDNMFTTEGYHIDLLIGILLFEKGEFKKAYQYFQFLLEKFNDKETVFLINKFLSAKEK